MYREKKKEVEKKQGKVEIRLQEQINSKDLHDNETIERRQQFDTKLEI